MELPLTVALIAVVILTIAYKILPYRIVADKKPSITFLPKYKKHISTSLITSELKEEFAQCGFIEAATKNNTTYFTRGYFLGDFSIHLAKIKLGITPIGTGEYEITIEAGWIAAFDTGDFWTFITELCRKLETT